MAARSIGIRRLGAHLLVLALVGSLGGCGHYGRRLAAETAVEAIGLMLGGLAAAALQASCRDSPDRCAVEDAPEDYRPPRKPRVPWTPPPDPVFRPRGKTSLAMRARRPSSVIADARLVPHKLDLPRSLQSSPPVEIAITGQTGWVKHCGAVRYAIYDCPFDRPQCFFYTDEREVYACDEEPCYAHEPPELTAWCDAAAQTDGGTVVDWNLRRPR